MKRLQQEQQNKTSANKFPLTDLILIIGNPLLDNVQPLIEFSLLQPDLIQFDGMENTPKTVTLREQILLNPLHIDPDPMQSRHRDFEIGQGCFGFTDNLLNGCGSLIVMAPGATLFIDQLYGRQLNGVITMAEDTLRTTGC